LPVTLLARNWKHSIGIGDLVLGDESTFTVNLTDDGESIDIPGLVEGHSGFYDVSGAVSLGNTTLAVTSSRTNTTYGILRVLIQNDGTGPVIGTFNGLPEGSPITVGDETYYITYHYNAETGQFGSGNDVAIYSSYFAVPGAGVR
jgi:hypothetical protein